MRFNALTVGELAQQTGLTIRTLHYYDEIGLLKPSLRTDAGYRVYTPSDLSRLQQVLLLRQLGFSLAEVRRCLDHSDFSPLEVIRLYIAPAGARRTTAEAVRTSRSDGYPSCRDG